MKKWMLIILLLVGAAMAEGPQSSAGVKVYIGSHELQPLGPQNRFLAKCRWNGYARIVSQNGAPVEVTFYSFLGEVLVITTISKFKGGGEADTYTAWVPLLCTTPYKNRWGPGLPPWAGDTYYAIFKIRPIK